MVVPAVPAPGPTMTVPEPPKAGSVAPWTVRVTAPPLRTKRRTPVAQLTETCVHVFVASVSLEFVAWPAVVKTIRRLAGPEAVVPLTPSDQPPFAGSPKRTNVCWTRADGRTHSSTPLAVPGTVAVMVPPGAKRAARFGGALKAPRAPDVTAPCRTPSCEPPPTSAATAPDVSSSGQYATGASARTAVR